MNLSTRIAILAGAVALGGAALALPAAATPVKTPTVCGDWKLRGATGAYPAIVFGDAPDHAAVLSADKVKLVKPATGVMPGVEFAAFDLDVEATSEVKVSVRFDTDADASTASGAVRVFGYNAKGANTIVDGPSYMDEAEGTSGTLVFTLPAGKKLGTLGLVYDGSNSAKGAVTFSDLTIGQRPVSFRKCVTPTPSVPVKPVPSTSKSSSATASASASASATRSSSSAAAADSDAGGLPVTGPGVGTIVGIGAGMVALGGLLGVASIATRRRTRKFTA